MQKFKLAGKAKHVDRKSLWQALTSSLGYRGFGPEHIVDMAQRERLGMISNESQLHGVNNLLSRGLPVQDLEHLRPEVDTNLYSQAFKAGIHPRVLNEVMDQYRLGPARGDVLEDVDTGHLAYRQTHNGLEDLISSVSRGATVQESVEALKKLLTVHNSLSREFPPETLKQLRREEPELPESFPSQSHVETVRPSTEREIRKMGGLKSVDPEYFASTQDTALNSMSSYEDIEEQGINTGVHDISATQPGANVGRPSKDNAQGKSNTVLDAINDTQSGSQMAGLNSYIENLGYSEEEARKKVRTLVNHHPLRLYSNFRSIPNSTHGEFLDAVNSCTQKWGQFLYHQKLNPSLSVPRLLNVFTNFRLSGASHEEAKSLLREMGPESLKRLQSQTAQVPFHEFREAWDRSHQMQSLVSGSRPLLHVDAMSKYLWNRLGQGQTHQESLKDVLKIPSHEFQEAWETAQHAQESRPDASPSLHTNLMNQYLSSRINEGKSHKESLDSVFYPGTPPPVPRRNTFIRPKTEAVVFKPLTFEEE